MKTFIDIVLIAIVILIVAVIANAFSKRYYGSGYGYRYYTTQQVPVQQNGINISQPGYVTIPNNQTQTTTTTYYTQ